MKRMKTACMVGSLILLCACQKMDGICQFQHTPHEGWNYHDTLTFNSPASSADADFDLQLMLRINRKFLYRDIWIVVEQEYMMMDDGVETAGDKTGEKEERKSPTTQTSNTVDEDSTAQAIPYVQPDQRTFCDTLHISLTDSTETFNGNGLNLLEYVVPVRFVHLKEGEGATFRIHHIMNEHSITGVHDVGLQFSKLQ